MRARVRRRCAHNCSGKHAGMLALCRVKGWASGGYAARDAWAVAAPAGVIAEVAGHRDINPAR